MLSRKASRAKTKAEVRFSLQGGWENVASAMLGRLRIFRFLGIIALGLGGEVEGMKGEMFLGLNEFMN